MGQGGFNGEVGVTVVASSAEDTVYDGESNSDLVVFVEDLEPPGIQVSKTALEMPEGTQTAYQVSLATASLSPVTVTVALSWASGQPHDLAVQPTSLTFAAGEAQVWKTVSLDVPLSEGFIGDSEAVLTHSASSADVFYDSTNAVGAPAVDVVVSVLEQDRVGVCLGSCLQATRYDHLFYGDGGDRRRSLSAVGVVEMPHEVLSGNKVRSSGWAPPHPPPRTCTPALHCHC